MAKCSRRKRGKYSPHDLRRLLAAIKEAPTLWREAGGIVHHREYEPAGYTVIGWGDSILVRCEITGDCTVADLSQALAAQMRHYVQVVADHQAKHHSRELTVTMTPASHLK